MNVCIIGSRSPRLFSAGVENIIMSLALELKKQGHKVMICCIGSKSFSSRVKGIRVNEFLPDSFLGKFNYSNSLKGYLDYMNFDVVHVHGVNNGVTLIALLAKKNNKLVLSFNSSGSNSLSLWFLKIGFYGLIRLLKKRVGHYICISRFEKDHFKMILGEPESKFSIIPFGVDKKEMDSVQAKVVKGKIISIGRLVKNKGFHHLINSLEFIKSDFHLEIFGSGSEKFYLENLVYETGNYDKVKFVSEFPYSKRKEYLKRLKESEVVVLLSDYESQGIVITDAISLGKPILVKDSTALHDHVLDYGITGIKDINNYREIGLQLELMLLNPKRFIPKNTKIISQKETNLRTIKIYEGLKEWEL